MTKVKLTDDLILNIPGRRTREEILDVMRRSPVYQRLVQRGGEDLVYHVIRRALSCGLTPGQVEALMIAEGEVEP